MDHDERTAQSLLADSTAVEKIEALEMQVEALSREVERLTVLASRERGLAEALLNHSPHGIIVADASGKLILQNKASERIWGGSATANEIADWSKYRAFHADGRPFEASDWSLARALMRQEVVEDEEIRFQRFDGTRGVMLGSSAPIFDAQGKLSGGLSVFNDITHFKRQQQELRIAGDRYFTTLKSIGDAVICTDAHGVLTFLNPIAEALTGWSLDTATGVPLVEVFRIVNEQTRETVESPVDKVIREGTIVGLANHTILIARDGTETAIDDSGAPIFDDDGKLVGVVLVFRDVGEKRREEQRREFIAAAGAMLASSLDYATTLSSVARLAVPTIADWCAVDMCTPSGEVERLAVTHVDPEKVEWVKRLQERYPSDPESPYGVHEVIRTGVSQRMAEIPDELLVNAAKDAEHLRLIRQLGLRSSMVVPLRCRGRTLGAITLVSAESNRRFGATELAFAEELAGMAALAVDNARLYEEARDANRAKDDFLATVSHELRTPLNAMLGWANLLRGSTLSDEKRSHALETIERNARMQAQLIDDLLDVSRIISGNLRLDLRSLDLVSIIETAVDGVRPAAEAKGVSVRLQLDRQAGHVTGDAGRIQQVVWNLLSNAVKFTDRGGSVTVVLGPYASQTEICVTDTGMGIEPEALPHIFERFKQANATSARSHGGLGLGLAIVKHLVELHGGSVMATSAGLGHGASFVVRLPVAAVARKEHPSSPEPAARMVGPSLDGLFVLVVDDEPDARALLTTILEQRGAKVLAVESAAQALAVIEREPPDVLVSDIGMPGEDGYSLIHKARLLTRNNAKPLPAAALTAYASRSDRQRAMLAGFQAHVIKPVEAEELLVVVATLAGRTGGIWSTSE